MAAQQAAAEAPANQQQEALQQRLGQWNAGCRDACGKHQAWQGHTAVPDSTIDIPGHTLWVLAMREYGKSGWVAGKATRSSTLTSYCSMLQVACQFSNCKKWLTWARTGTSSVQ